MRFSAIVTAVGALAMVAGCSGTAQQQGSLVAHATKCSDLKEPEREVAKLYAKDNVLKVEAAHRPWQGLVRADQRQRYVAGAHLYVPAERDTNAAYLERVLSCYAAERRPGVHASDPLRVKGVHDVDVRTVGPNVRVAITGADRHAGKAILQHARALVTSEVKVRQLAGASAPDAAL